MRAEPRLISTNESGPHWDQASILLPAVTVCSLNRVHCHNAVDTLLRMKRSLNTSGLSGSARAEVERELEVVSEMVAAEVTDCLPTFCVAMKKRVERSHQAQL